MVSLLCKPAPTPLASSQQPHSCCLSLHLCSHRLPSEALRPHPPLQPPGPSQASRRRARRPAASFTGLPIQLVTMTSRPQEVISQRNNNDDSGDDTDPRANIS